MDNETVYDFKEYFHHEDLGLLQSTVSELKEFTDIDRTWKYPIDIKRSGKKRKWEKIAEPITLFFAVNQAGIYDILLTFELELDICSAKTFKQIKRL